MADVSVEYTPMHLFRECAPSRILINFPILDDPEILQRLQGHVWVALTRLIQSTQEITSVLIGLEAGESLNKRALFFSTLRL
jgi:hypothetical protein